MRRRLCFAPDLVNDTAKFVEYEQFRRPGGALPQILDDIRRPH